METVAEFYASMGVTRSPKWPAVRRAFLKAHPVCEACGATKSLEVHHKKPFHVFPDRELDPTNLITLCDGKGRWCHLTFGHLMNWGAYNTRVVGDAHAYRKRLSDRRATSLITVLDADEVDRNG